jgi:hypothetical protein
MAVDAVADGAADMVAFGKLFISNPDLVNRLRLDAPLASPDSNTFYGGDARGYTDYPPLDSEQQASGSRRRAPHARRPVPGVAHKRRQVQSHETPILDPTLGAAGITRQRRKVVTKPITKSGKKSDNPYKSPFNPIRRRAPLQ